MAGATRHSKSSDASARAEQALSSGDLFQAERLAYKNLMAARAEHDFGRMASIVPGLMEPRLRRLRVALEARKITIIDASIGEDIRAAQGCYLIQPPQVGADARRLRLAAFEQDVPAAVLCREPLTQVRLLPIVALSPGMTLRTKIAPPRNMDKPDMAWFAGAIEALGTFAIETLDATMPASRRVDALLDRLDALPEHEGLHHALQQACLEAQAERDRALAAKAARKAANPARPADDLAEADDDDDGEAEGDLGREPDDGDDDDEDAAVDA